MTNAPITPERLDAIETLPRSETEPRVERVRALLAKAAPEASGLLVFSRVNLYWLTGTMPEGVLWIPRSGDPVLAIRRGYDRAVVESELGRIVRMRSYGDLAGLFAEGGTPLGEVVAAEMGGLHWNLGELLQAKLPGVRFVPGDGALKIARSVKSPYELGKMRLAGARHNEGMTTLLPRRIKPGMTERDIAHAVWEVYFSLGHSGHMRMSGAQEVFLGHVSSGDSGNYPSVFNGPLGLRGEHPAIPFGGYAGKIWRPGEVLSIDTGFCLEGYNSDKTHVYFAGPKSALPEAVARPHAIMVAIQNRLAAMLKPGAKPSDLAKTAYVMAEEAGLSAGFMGLAANKVPFIGHGIGLEIDEWPVVAKGFDEPLEAGVVMALEPKIGLPGLGMVGIENTFEVTEAGGVALTGTDYEIICVE